MAKLTRETQAQTPPSSFSEKVDNSRDCRTNEFEIINASSSKRSSDFEILHNVLGRWHAYENDRIERSYFGTSKLAARAMVLSKEIQLLRSIEAIKTRVRVARRERRYLEHLERLTEPEIWNFSEGKRIFVETLRVQRARECRDFYRSLETANFTSRSDRIETLIKLRRYTIGHTCDFAINVISLIDQERELLLHVVDSKALDALRNRLKLALLRLSLSFCEPRGGVQVENPQVSRATKVQKNSSSKLCSRCGKFLHLNDLVSSISLSDARSFVTITCENCKSLQLGKEPRIVYKPYELMLLDLRRQEAGLNASERCVAFVVDPQIIYRLVNYVWHGKSGISECDDLFRLMLVRFRPEREWSPWNTLVLTKREAALHRAMPDPWKIYAPGLVKKFIIKNLQAKLRFDFLTRMNFGN